MGIKRKISKKQSSLMHYDRKTIITMSLGTWIIILTGQ